ncbi:MAG: XRE family transcriptional regulator [Acholeplasma sp.]|nr:MAG: XRE family transcriptional regulator [Acholeplasma sp.]
MEYSQKIKLLREKMFVSQKELAETLGVSFVSVNRWETGKFNPTIKAKKKLNQLFIQYKIAEGNDDNKWQQINFWTKKETIYRKNRFNCKRII